MWILVLFLGSGFWFLADFTFYHVFLTIATMQKEIKDILQASIDVKHKVLSDALLTATIEQVTRLITTAFANGNKVLFCGNGGSAADAQHLAAEFSGRFYTDRDPLPP